MSRRVVITSLASALAAVAALAGCFLLAPVDEHASADAGAAGDATSEVTTPDGGEIRCDDCSCLFVNASSRAEQPDGCSTRSAFPSITAALSAARTRDTAMRPVKEIRICEGRYDGALLLDIPVSLRGGYECAGWTTDPDAAFPRFAHNVTSVYNPSFSATLNATLKVAPALGRVIGPEVSVSGLRIQGGPAAGGGDARSFAVVLQNTHVRFHDNDVVGGATESSRFTGSVGLDVIGAAPLVERNRIDGGKGRVTEPGGLASVGLMLEGGRVVVRGNRIHGGEGRGTVGGSSGSVGLRIQAAADEPFTGEVHDNEIDGGGGTVAIGPGIASAGVDARLGTRVTLIGNVIRAGGGTSDVSTPGGLVSVGVNLAGHTAATVVGNRITGGQLRNRPVQSATTAVHVAVRNDTVGSAEITNNFIAGGPGATDGTGPGYADTYAVLVEGGGYVALRHDTLLAGAAVQRSVALQIGLTNPGPLHVVANNNLLVQRDARATEYALGLASCSNAGLNSFSGNYVVGASLFSPGPGCGFAADTAELERLLQNAGAAAGGTKQSACDAGAGDCGRAVFDPWSAYGYDQIAMGWRLRRGAICDATVGSAGSGAFGPDGGSGAGTYGAVLVDAYGVTRGSGSVTPGAEQRAASSCP